MVEAVAERDEAFAAAVQAHVRKGSLVEAVALDHDGVRVAHRLSELRAAVALVADDRPTGKPDGAALLFERGRVEDSGAGGADVENSDGLCHGMWGGVGKRVGHSISGTNLFPLGAPESIQGTPFVFCVLPAVAAEWCNARPRCRRGGLNTGSLGHA